MTWKIDASHSQVQFSVRHMMISNARGRFEELEGTVDFDGRDLSTLAIDVRIRTESINTRDQQRDGHLRSGDFFDTENHPWMSFRSNRVEKLDDRNAKVHGALTIRDVTRPVVLDVEFNGMARSPWGTESAGFSAHARVNRKEFGLTWNQALETGGLLVGEEVKIEIELELVKENVAVESDAEPVAA